MCGIGVTVGAVNTVSLNGHDVLRRRGPNGARNVVQQVSPRRIVYLEATVLHMQGTSMTSQPVSLPQNGGLFCWNGEVYQMQMENGKTRELSATTTTASDTELLSGILDRALMQHLHQTNDDALTLETLASVMSRVVNGEYAFCLVTKTSVFYGRDKWGRRSLLLSDGEDAWRLSSVATDCSLPWTEVPPGLVYQYNIETGITQTTPLKPPAATFALSVNNASIMERPAHVSESMWLASLQLQVLLTDAVRQQCSCCYIQEGVGIMFSGGLDSVVLAALAAQVLPPTQSLDLINVSFGEASADRQAALQSYQELKTLYPNRTLRLVCVDIEWDQVVQHEARIQQLMHPKTTTMDLNISTALWFAARGEGVVIDAFDDDNSFPYTSPCRILLMGMGADELMAGYGRHRKSFLEYGGYNRLGQELDMDRGRLWERNLGRDDRVVSDHGKEARFPYLDTNVVNFLTALPLKDVCDFTQDPGVGDKMILWLIAQRLGLKICKWISETSYPVWESHSSCQ